MFKKDTSPSHKLDIHKPFPLGRLIMGYEETRQ
jgi:hypothetical protein